MRHGTSGRAKKVDMPREVDADPMQQGEDHDSHAPVLESTHFGTQKPTATRLEEDLSNTKRPSKGPSQ